MVGECIVKGRRRVAIGDQSADLRRGLDRICDGRRNRGASSSAGFRTACTSLRGRVSRGKSIPVLQAKRRPKKRASRRFLYRCTRRCCRPASPHTRSAALSNVFPDRHVDRAGLTTLASMARPHAESGSKPAMPAYPRMAASFVTNRRPSAIACAMRSRSNGSSWRRGSDASFCE